MEHLVKELQADWSLRETGTAGPELVPLWTAVARPAADRCYLRADSQGMAREASGFEPEPRPRVRRRP